MRRNCKSSKFDLRRYVRILTLTIVCLSFELFNCLNVDNGIHVKYIHTRDT